MENFHQIISRNIEEAINKSLREVRNSLLARGVSKEIVDDCIAPFESVKEEDEERIVKRQKRLISKPEKSESTLEKFCHPLIILDFSDNKHLIKGEFFKPQYVGFKTELKEFARFSKNLACGPAWSFHPQMLNMVKEICKKYEQLEFYVITYKDYLEGKKPQLLSFETETKPPLEPVVEKKKVKARKNKWGNFADENGFVFRIMRLSSPKDPSKSRKTTVAIGVQDEEADPERCKGLNSLYYFTEDKLAVCEKNGWQVLTEELLEDALKFDKTVKKQENEFRILLSNDEESESEHDLSNDEESEHDTSSNVYISLSVKIKRTDSDDTKRVKLAICFTSNDLFKKYEDDLYSFEDSIDDYIDREYGNDGWYYDDKSKIRFIEILEEEPDENDIALEVKE